MSFAIALATRYNLCPLHKQHESGIFPIFNPGGNQMQIERLDVNHRRSRLVKYNGMCFLSGQFSDSDKDITQQTRETLAKIDDLLARAGTDKSRLLTAQIWLREMSDFKAMNEVWDAWIDPANPPTRCCGQVLMADPDMRIEIVVSAAI
ncbi:RidA family protein [Brucella pecoris]|uniref:Enamine deaminase RidA (YjgF/YER057c/UK114 family) n=2 Tax=Brucella pecoris TaxID=867683 RepID=A0AB34YVM9_9HYPH|nr:enamine deaminase RidA (YjgF/YER057c/UK114 family) [Brucella pecoris]